ncbi:hypothetical protein LCGC14_2655040 [marine sediment metagenome]|uniref:Uncharacterized protein n=1 Tax=marine sediment metagenome TaxID=412755 RepID=A0A0F8ZTR1_9ZZZZ
MNENAHIIRKPQFITRDGPGSLIETINETRLIFNMTIGYDNSVNFEESFLKKYEINDPRLLALLSKDINKDIKILDILTNEMLNKGSMEVIYKTKRFPRWYICHKKGHILKAHPIKSVLFRPTSDNNFSCPLCHTGMKDSTSVRFVMACPDGHMDDVSWNSALHSQKTNCIRTNNEEEIYEWEAYSTNLASINIRCPYCLKLSKTMKEIFYHPFKCSGLYQERFTNQPPTESACGREMKVIQKNSSALRLTSVINFLEIPKYTSPLGVLFKEEYSTCLAINTLIKYAFTTISNESVKKKMLTEVLRKEYKGDNFDMLMDIIENIPIDDIIQEITMLFNDDINFIDCINDGRT